MDDSKKNAISFGVCSIILGVVVLLFPDMTEDYTAFGRHIFAKEMISKVWGTTLGWILVAGGAFALFGVVSNNDDED